MKWNDKIKIKKIYYADSSKTKIEDIAYGMDRNDWIPYRAGRKMIEESKKRATEEIKELTAIELFSDWLQQGENIWKFIIAMTTFILTSTGLTLTVLLNLEKLRHILCR